VGVVADTAHWSGPRGNTKAPGTTGPGATQEAGKTAHRMPPADLPGARPAVLARSSPSPRPIRVIRSQIGHVVVTIVEAPPRTRRPHHNTSGSAATPSQKPWHRPRFAASFTPKKPRGRVGQRGHSARLRFRLIQVTREARILDLQQTNAYPSVCEQPGLFITARAQPCRLDALTRWPLEACLPMQHALLTPLAI
jgi:hypothetical protein